MNKKDQLLELYKGKHIVIVFMKGEIDYYEKMKNFYNCKHSSRALCPNEHKCKGCEDWELTE